jgi:hypothetical protein
MLPCAANRAVSGRARGPRVCACDERWAALVAGPLTCRAVMVVMVAMWMPRARVGP